MQTERQNALLRIAKGTSISSENQPPARSGCDDGSDCECDDLMDDDFLQHYNAMRMQQMKDMQKQQYVHYLYILFLMIEFTLVDLILDTWNSLLQKNLYNSQTLYRHKC